MATIDQHEEFRRMKGKVKFIEANRVKATNKPREAIVELVATVLT